jgi:hypothetical protein
VFDGETNPLREGPVFEEETTPAGKVVVVIEANPLDLTALVDLHDGPEHSPSSNPSDKLISISGGLDEAEVRAEDAGCELVAGKEVNPKLELLLVVLGGVHAVPEHKMPRMPQERLTSIRGGHEDVLVVTRIAVGRFVLATGRVVEKNDDLEDAIMPDVLDGLHAGPEHRPPRISREILTSTKGCRLEVGATDGPVLRPLALTLGGFDVACDCKVICSMPRSDSSGPIFTSGGLLVAGICADERRFEDMAADKDLIALDGAEADDGIVVLDGVMPEDDLVAVEGVKPDEAPFANEVSTADDDALTLEVPSTTEDPIALETIDELTLVVNVERQDGPLHKPSKTPTLNDTSIRGGTLDVVVGISRESSGPKSMMGRADDVGTAPDDKGDDVSGTPRRDNSGPRSSTG